MMAANGTVMSSSVGQPMYTDYYYENANGMDTKNCYGYLQATYTSDSGKEHPLGALLSAAIMHC